MSLGTDDMLYCRKMRYNCLTLDLTEAGSRASVVGLHIMCRCRQTAMSRATRGGCADRQRWAADLVGSEVND
jgi:hypothetical protein